MGNLRITKNELNDIRMQLTNTVRHDEMFDDEERLITGRR